MSNRPPISGPDLLAEQPLKPVSKVKDVWVNPHGYKASFYAKRKIYARLKQRTVRL
jgi:hypothetical protein